MRKYLVHKLSQVNLLNTSRLEYSFLVIYKHMISATEIVFGIFKNFRASFWPVYNHKKFEIHDKHLPEPKIYTKPSLKITPTIYLLN